MSDWSELCSCARNLGVAVDGCEVILSRSACHLHMVWCPLGENIVNKKRRNRLLSMPQVVAASDDSDLLASLAGTSLASVRSELAAVPHRALPTLRSNKANHGSHLYHSSKTNYAFTIVDASEKQGHANFSHSDN